MPAAKTYSKLPRTATAALAAVLCCAGPAAAANPIPEGPNSLPVFTGSPVTPAPVFSPDPPRHPHMAPNARSKAFFRC